MNVKGLGDEEVFKICREFIENSCRNYSACDKIYDSWIESAIGSARRRGFKGFSLDRFKEKNQDIKDFLEETLSE